MCGKKYDHEMAGAKLETLGWEGEPPPEWAYELDETGTKLVPKDKLRVEVP